MAGARNPQEKKLAVGRKPAAWGTHQTMTTHTHYTQRNFQKLELGAISAVPCAWDGLGPRTTQEVSEQSQNVPFEQCHFAFTFCLHTFSLKLTSQRSKNKKS